MKRYIRPRQYVIYFIWSDDNTEDSIIVETAQERDIEINNMIKRKDFSYISWCYIYQDGEYGQTHIILDER